MKINAGKTGKRLCICIWICSLLLLSVSGCAGAENESQDTAPEPTFAMTAWKPGGEMPQYGMVTEKDGYALYADMETGLFELKNVNTEKSWHSTPTDAEDDMQTKGTQRMDVRSQLVIEYVFQEDESKSEYIQTANSQIGCLEEGDITVGLIDDGILVVYDFSVLGISIPVAYTLCSGYLNAAIDINGIVEGDQCFLTAIRLLPTFGAGNWEDEGYLFVPDGSGAIVEFNNQALMSDEYDAFVYGDEMANPAESKSVYTETVRLPVFGIVTGGEALMGVVSQGDGAASITVFNGNDRCGYNAVSSKAHLRILSTQKNLFNKKSAGKVSKTGFGLKLYEVRYYPLAGEHADYTGMAAKYRDYLIAEKGLKKQTEASTPAFHIDLVGTVTKEASFLGIPYEKKQALTTYAQGKEILEALEQEGIGSLSVRYLGWSGDGLKNRKIPQKAEPMSILGGQKGFDAFRDYLLDKGYDLYPDTDLLTFRSSGNGISKSNDSVRTIFREPAYKYSYMLSVFERVLERSPTRCLTVSKLSDAASRYLSSVKSNGLPALSLGTLGNFHYSNFDAKKQDYRSVFSTKVESVLEHYKEAGIALSFESGNAYVLPYASLIVSAPSSSSGYTIFDRDVPFYQMVLHGYVSYTTVSIVQSSNLQTEFLKAIETGSELLYTGMYEDAASLRDTEYNNFYGATWSLWIQKAAEQYNAYAPLLKKIHGKTITAHKELGNNVFLTTYENGTKVAVNYNEQEAVIGGHTVPASGFCEWEGE